MTGVAGILPDEPDLFLVYAGMETDLIFNRGIDLPGFASYPLLEGETGRDILRGYLEASIELARQSATGVILESPTWVANADRARDLGYTPEQLAGLNQAAISLLADVRATAPDVPTILSANIGPRSDAYAPEAQMTDAQATAYHAHQISVVAETSVDVISGYTLAYPAEAIGISACAEKIGRPAVISFTVETNGRLPTGATLAEAISEVDAATGSYPSYYMINCAHPEHFEDVLKAGAWMDRIGGVVANASRCSHAELDNADVLDDGSPIELGAQLAALRRRFPHLRVLGGCCGTDMRHMTAIAVAAI